MTKFLPKAIALAVSLGAAASAHATNVNSDGLGQVLLYPVYTVEQGNDTAISVTNTTNQIKAVKVRFVEGMNSQEVLDFNLYLSPKDVWNGVVVRSENGAKLVTSDKSCTAPAIPAAGVEFRNTQYLGTDYDAGKGGPQTTDRTRVGHVELIEMGVVDPLQALAGGVTAKAAIVHTAAGVPGNCQAVVDSFKTVGALQNVWAANPNQGLTIPTGGLYGVGTITNVLEGTQVGFDATALNDFAPGALHQNPGNVLPALTEGNPFATFSDGTQAGFASGIDAVSAVLAKTNIQNEFAHGAGVDAKTDWVVTFPTKSEYVNLPGLVATAPFTAAWSDAKVGTVAGSSCQAIGLTSIDREEAQIVAVADDVDFSPLPPAAVVPGIALCFETNIVSFNNSNVLAGTGNYVHFNYNVAYQAGWADMSFTAPANVLTGTTGVVTPSADPLLPPSFAPTAGNTVINGLPTIGFAMMKVSNGQLENAGKTVLSNYSSAWNHKSKTSTN